MSDHAALVLQVRQRRQLLDRQYGQAEQVARQYKAAKAEVARLTELTELHAQVGGMLTRIGEEAQETAREKVQRLATRALQVIFGPELSFLLEPGELGGQATLKLVVRSTYGGTVLDTPVLEARGGGLAAVVGFVLRLVVLLLTPELRRLMFLDEPFAHVSARYEPRVAEFLREVVDKARVQIVLVTHSQVYGDYADARVHLELGADGVTTVSLGQSE